MSTCPYCGAETRPGDNFCLSCGHRLSAASSSPQQQAQPVAGEATVPAQEGWRSPLADQGTIAASPGASWPDANVATIAGNLEPTLRGDSASTVAGSGTGTTIENPAKFILRSESGEILQEYPLDKPEMIIGRQANSDIVLSKDKLTSRRHAKVQYENGNYILRDEGSSNGTFVNGQQLEGDSTHILQDGDHIGIGEYELVFRAPETGFPQSSVPDMPTVAVPFNAPQEVTYRTRGDELATAANDDFGTRTMDNGSAPAAPEAAQAAPPPATPAPIAEEAPAAPPAAPLPAEASELASTKAPIEMPDSSVTFARLTSIPQPSLPDMSPLLAALSSLDGQVMSLQEQLNKTQEALHTHDEELARTTNQLRSGVRNVAERMNSTIADVARTREALSWAELRQLMEDVMNNPRDIEYVTKLARRSRELNKVFLLHQEVLNTMAECYSLLRGLIGEEK